MAARWLNGWRRLWIFASVLSLLAALSYAIYTFPQAVDRFPVPIKGGSVMMPSTYSENEAREFLIRDYLLQQDQLSLGVNAKEKLSAGKVPSEVLMESEWSKLNSKIWKAKEVDKVTTENLRGWFAYHYPGGTLADMSSKLPPAWFWLHVMAQELDLGKEEQKIRATAEHLFKVESAEREQERGKHIALILGIWAISCAVIYILGVCIAWVTRGFRRS
jgi:hypothetical protein